MERDHRRIHRIQSLIVTLWNMNPDMRYLQLMDLIGGKIRELKGMPPGADIFYTEDTVAEQAINLLISGK